MRSTWRIILLTIAFFAMVGGVSWLSQDTIAERFALKPLASLSGAEFGKKVPKFAGITINGLALNRVEGEALVPLLKAKLLKSSKRSIILKDVTIYRGEEVELVPEATLVTKPQLGLEWPEGSYTL